MQKALAKFDVGLEEVHEMLVAIAFNLDRIPACSDESVLNAGIEKALVDISDACALLDARRIVFAHEACC